MIFSSIEKFGNKIKRRLLRQEYEREAREADEAIEHLGSPYGGWHLPIDRCHNEMVAVCAGAGEDISFDIELAKKFKAKVYIVDPTPRAVSHVNRVISGLEAGRDSVGPYKLSGVKPPQLRFLPMGLWSHSTTLRFYAPKDPKHVSHSALNLQKSEDYFEADCLSLKELMKHEDIEKIDLLKLDIEGSEYEVLEAMIRDSIFPEVICVEFDEAGKPADAGWSGRIQSAVSLLKSEGYEIAYYNGFNMSLTRRQLMV